MPKQSPRKSSGSLTLLVLLAGVIARPADSIAAEPWEDESHIAVCRDGGAGGYEAFPDVVRLKDSRLMCVFYAGHNHVSEPNPEHPKGGRIMCVISDDEGSTWSAPNVVYDGPKDDRDPSITQLSDGRLACTFFPYPGGSVNLLYSDDAGDNWSDPREIAPPYEVSSPVRELKSGRLILGIYAAPEGANAYGAAIFSDDGGKTWGKPVNLDNGGVSLDAETDIVELRPNRLLAVMRGSRVPMHSATSDDGGETWSKSRSADFVAHSPYLHKATDGTLVLGYRQPAPVQKDWKTVVRLSRDDGTTWGKPVLVDAVLGAYPSMVNLKDGSVLIVYYDEEKDDGHIRTNIRARRFRIKGEGVEWLTLGATPQPQ